MSEVVPIAKYKQLEEENLSLKERVKKLEDERENMIDIDKVIDFFQAILANAGCCEPDLRVYATFAFKEGVDIWESDELYYIDYNLDDRLYLAKFLVILHFMAGF